MKLIYSSIVLLFISIPVYSQTNIIDSLNSGTGPGASEDGYALTWDNTMGEYTLQQKEDVLTFTNGLTRQSNIVKLGGALIEDTTIGDSYTYRFAIMSNQTDINSNTVNINGISNSTQAPVTKISVSENDLKISDFRSTAKGIEYDNDYSDNYTDRSLVDKGYANFGEYVPTVTNDSNTIVVDAGLSYYQKIGNVVQGANKVVVNPSTSTDMVFSFSLPISTNSNNIYINVNVREQYTNNNYLTFGYGALQQGRIQVVGTLDSTKNYDVWYTYTYKIE